MFNKPINDQKKEQFTNRNIIDIRCTLAITDYLICLEETKTI